MIPTENIPLTGPSLCVQCAKHPSLKGFIHTHSATDIECAICGLQGIEVSAPNAFPGLVNLIRALIRFHYGEWEYNPHWGGEDIDTILLKENPIFEHAKSNGKILDQDRIETFLQEISWPPYPPPDKGISIYAGFEETIGRMVAPSISKSPSELLTLVTQELKHKNFFDVEKQLEKPITEIVKLTRITIPRGKVYHRARVGVERTYQRYTEGWEVPIVYQPYLDDKIGAPPPPLATQGRINRQGVSFLYLSTNKETAAAEVRPYPGQLISLGTFIARRELTVIDFDVDIAAFATSELQLELFHMVHSIERMLSTPVPPGELEGYNTTQLIADLIRRQGIDGLSYRSSVGAGTNLCAFQPGDFEIDPRQPKIMRVKSLKYELLEMPVVISPGDDDHEIS